MQPGTSGTYPSSPAVVVLKTSPYVGLVAKKRDLMTTTSNSFTRMRAGGNGGLPTLKTNPKSAYTENESDVPALAGL